jgi:hypothetical protein
MVILPHQYSELSTYDLLDAVARGRIGFDHRVLRVILDRGEDAIADLVRWGTEDHEDEDQYDLSEELIAIFRHLRTPKAIPFFEKYIRDDPGDLSEDLIEALYPIREAAIDPLLRLYEEFGEEEGGEIIFILAGLGVKDDRILKHLIERLDYDLLDATISLSLYGDPAARPALNKALNEVADDIHLQRNIEEALSELGRAQDEERAQWSIWDDFPEKSLPEFSEMVETDLLDYLNAPDPEYRLGAAESTPMVEPTERLKSALLERAKSDEDPAVRGKCWEMLADRAEDKNIRDAMFARLRDENVPMSERKGALLGLCGEAAREPVRGFIERFFAKRETRAAALKAMWGSMDRGFSHYFPKCLDDPDSEVVRQAIAGVGHLQLHDSAEALRRFFEEEEHRPGALFAYALALRHEISRGRIRSLLRKVEAAAGGLTEEETELVKIALDERLLLHGQQPVFSEPLADDSLMFDEPVPVAVKAKVGRNDPCPCGSGKKFKKCCGG